MTLTFKDRQITASEAQRRFHSLWTNVFTKKVAGRYFRVLQYQRVRWWVGEHYGTPHYHLIVLLPGIREGSQYDPVTKTWTVGPALRELEALFDLSYGKYGFGPQHRFEPLRHGAAVGSAVSYIVGYLQNGIDDAIARPIEKVRESFGFERTDKVVPRSYFFGRRVLPVGPSETTLRWGRKKRAMIRTYCLEYDLTFDEFEMQADAMFWSLPPWQRSREFWRREIVPLFQLRQIEPF